MHPFTPTPGVRNEYVVATLSRWPDLLRSFLNSVRSCGYVDKVLVADDGLPSSEDFGNVERMSCIRPFSFVRNANAIIEYAGDRDVFLCNDDTRVTGSIDALAEVASDARVGIVSPAVVGACAEAQVPTTHNNLKLRSVERMVFFFSAIYLPRRTIRHIGQLDDVPEGDDVGFTRRCFDAGLINVVDERCRVYHEHGSTSFERLRSLGE